ncbi:MAG: 23S rRNA (uracil(1939)-C(5))-methyltransferase RlmD [bacterium]
MQKQHEHIDGLEIKKLVYEGFGLGNGDEKSKTVFVRKAYPGDVVNVELFKRKRANGWANVLEVVKPSPSRVEPRCVHFKECGGCPWQGLEYSEQLRWKQTIIQEVLDSVGKLNVKIEPVLPSGDTFGFRNKVELSFEADEQGHPFLGFHKQGSHWEVLNISMCPIQTEIAQRAMKLIQDFFAQTTLPVYESRDNSGFLKSFTIRYSFYTGKLLFGILTNMGNFPEFDDLGNLLKKELGDTFAGILWFIEKQEKGKATTRVIQAQKGDDFLEEQVNGMLFTIPATAFFQTNSQQAEQLAKVTLDFADLQADDTLIDVYCGSGFFTLQGAMKCKSATGIELEPELILMAEQNAIKNSISNATFLTGNSRPVLKTFVLNEKTFSVCIIDPPRSGLIPKVVTRIAALAPKRIVYVSCNPVTFARDCQLFAEEGYHLKKVQPVDMFPQTYHCEVVGLLER